MTEPAPPPSSSPALDADRGASAPDAPPGAPRGAPQRPRRTRLKWWHGALALFVGGVGAQVAGLLALLVAVVVVMGRGGGPPADVEQASRELVESFAVLGPTVLVTGLTMALVAVVTPLLARVPPKEALGIRGAPWPTFVAAPVGILALGPTSDGLRQLMERVAPDFTIGTLEGLDALARSAPLWAVLPVMALTPGIAEELLFRGMFQRSIRRPALAVGASGLLFAAYHADPHHVVAVVPLGLFLAWIGQRTGSVLVPITAHVVNNGAAVIGSRAFFDAATGEVEPTEWWWMPIGWVVAAVCAGVIGWATRRRGEAGGTSRE